MQKKQTTVLCGGCFNAIHEGHEWFLKRAKALGDCLVVVIANDAHNVKPYARPAAARARALRTLGIADKVVIGSAKGFLTTILKIRPQVVVLGYDQTLPADVSDALGEMKIIVRRMPQYKKLSTRALLAKRS